MRSTVNWIDDITPDSLHADPYPAYARLRDEAPVAWLPWANAWLVTRWDECWTAGTDTDRFASAANHPTLNRVFGEPNILATSGDEHRDLRDGVDPLLRPRAVNGYIDDLVRPVALERLSALEGRGEAELMSEFFEPVSVRGLGDLLGLGVDDDTLRRWFHELNVGISSSELDPAKLARADAVTTEIEERIVPLLERLTREPDESMLSHMLHGGRPEGDPRTPAQVLPSLKVILLGGMQEPGHAAGSTMLGLLGRSDDQLARVAADVSLVPTAVTEGLRWIAPIGWTERQAACDLELDGVSIPEGDVVEIVLSSANRDPARFERPDEFDIDRPRQSHMSFGNGEHFCSGHYFSRQLERIALEELLPALPGLRLDPDREPVVTGFAFRAPKQLYVRWDA
ncbi:cytochrome P450 [Capillimicrobium parvum]|uniref:Aromatic O-demethylase, cytochrome P450 subunit n=1 Tax=Capillimicrobium parvum TaxID=2884022 RepID=A0A9E6Y025_9ACTN|nr:cytochrome P450 [Capillimicrobium parvum]UGS37308.1 Aromatic O-demethylase, cytochrome P450 subunit [Capillimicrobium parvum]